ncbi:TIGR02587 family membrane protein [Pseudonocardia nigra]|uniref:TIGR02587 family membrane protein n=1 Tax=Pseudonocardia nigra TaxID=1921578 RepID=UPI001C5F6468|nr:TIGR02587 family membrane protein [Pseudonocardia nigra]
MQLLKGVGRAFGGALLFALPLLMTMEMWRLGVSISRWRLALLVAVTVTLAVVLARYFGFLDKGGTGIGEAAVDGGVAVLVGVVAATVVLSVLSVVHPVQDWRSAVSIVAIEMLPATVGASFARSQLREDGGEVSSERSGPLRELTILAAGAAVFSASVAPTEEIVLLAARMNELSAVLLVALSLAVMHGFIYGVGFKGGAPSPDGFWRTFTRHTLVGYATALAVCAYLLWTFGRFDGLALQPVVAETIVLGLPASVGAAAARLIL